MLRLVAENVVQRDGRGVGGGRRTIGWHGAPVTDELIHASAQGDRLGRPLRYPVTGATAARAAFAQRHLERLIARSHDQLRQVLAIARGNSVLIVALQAHSQRRHFPFTARRVTPGAIVVGPPIEDHLQKGVADELSTSRRALGFALLIRQHEPAARASATCAALRRRARDAAAARSTGCESSSLRPCATSAGRLGRGSAAAPGNEEARGAQQAKRSKVCQGHSRIAAAAGVSSKSKQDYRS
jgi:hypothetical protein